MRKILFIDIDGTLVDYENNLPASAVEAVRAARNNGHKVYLCTGRPEGEIYQNIRDMGSGGEECRAADYVIFFAFCPEKLKDITSCRV